VWSLKCKILAVFYFGSAGFGICLFKNEICGLKQVITSRGNMNVLTAVSSVTATTLMAGIKVVIKLILST